MSGSINNWTTEFSKMLNSASQNQVGEPKNEVIGEKHEIKEGNWRFESLKKLPLLQSYNYYSEASISMILDCVSP
ncbi:hypothetical protein P3S68_023427 [Capsicum galapagoense]